MAKLEPTRDTVATAAEAFEATLGDPWNPDNTLSLRRAVELDEAETFPEDAVQVLDRIGFPARYVPTLHGGTLGSYEEMGYLVRAVARRDLTLIIAHAKTYLGAAATWVAGSEEQQKRLANTIKSGVPVSLALTERDHGSDLVAGELRAEPSGAGYALSGEKWLINNATRSGMLTVLARTRADGGFRGHSLFLVDKAALAPDSSRHLPKVRTLGIRGADISGISFANAELGPEALIGAPGHGLEITLKLLQLTRTNVSALSLGAVDTALRTVLDFSVSRRLYGGAVIDLPHARDTLAGVFADLLAGECASLVSCRALHLMPEEMAVHSAIAKYQVPTLAEGCIQRLGVILGARSYLREGHAFGTFQKIARDNPLVGIFDGSSVVNLHALGLQLRGLGSAAGASRTEGAQLFTLGGPLPPVDPARLAIASRKNSVEELLAEAIERAAESGASAEILDLARRVQHEMAETRNQAVALHKADPARFSRSPALFELARRYAALHTAACCVGVWAHNRAGMNAFLASGDYLVVAVARLLASAGLPVPPPPEARAQSLSEYMLDLHRRDALFSLRDIQLPARAPGDIR